MENNGVRITKTEKMLCIAIIVCVVFGNVINSGDFRIAGVVLNLYRVGIPIIACYYLVRRGMRKELLKYFSYKPQMCYMLVMLLWLVYGGILMFASQYASLHEGLKELLDIFLGLLTVYCITECCENVSTLRYFRKVIKVIVCILCIIGIMEMLCGIHFPSSKYVRHTDLSLLFQKGVKGISSGVIFPITTVFYGINDFAAFIAIFSPLFFVDKAAGKREKIRNIGMMLLITIIVSIGDANIGLVAMLFAVILMILLRGLNKYTTGYLVGIIVVQQWVAKWIGNGVVWIKSLIGKIPFIHNYLNGKNAVGDFAEDELINQISNGMEVLEAQLTTAEQGYGSLYLREMITLDSLDMCMSSYFLGVGPGGFTNYLKKNGSRTSLVDPHNWWLEILSQYGIFVFVAYVGMLLYIFIKTIKNYLKNKEFILLQLSGIFVAYVIASIAPSTFLGYGYQWIVPGLGIAALKIFSKKDAD